MYTTEEFIRKVRQGDRFAVESLEIGIALRGERFFRELRESVRKQWST